MKRHRSAAATQQGADRGQGVLAVILRQGVQHRAADVPRLPESDPRQCFFEEDGRGRHRQGIEARPPGMSPEAIVITAP